MSTSLKQVVYVTNLGAVIAVIIAVALFFLGPWTLWETPDQRGQRLEELGEFQDAAEHYADPMRSGVALFRDARFEAAAAQFMRVSSAEGNFNQGNSLLMAGNYTDAITAYEQSLLRKPDWADALTNLEIARLRAQRTELVGGDMTGGQMGADDFVFDSGPSNFDEGFDEVVEGGEPMSDMELQALWLRRVQTKPSDFLRAKFAYQVATDR